MIRRNILANLIAGAWVAALTIVITPIQIKLLGMEAFGLVSFINTMQIVFVAFELGLASTLTRELAADSSLDKSGSHALVRTASSIYWLCALLIGGSMLVLAESIATRWFSSESLDADTVTTGVGVIIIYLAIRWPIGLYAGILTGLQRMDVLNGIKAGMSTLRLLGGIFIIVEWSSLNLFLIWTALASLLEVTVYIVCCRCVYPSMPLGGTISITVIKQVWRFSASMSLLGLLGVLIVQLDRLFISKMLTLEDLGHYNLAYTLASTVAFVIGAFGSAMMPYFTFASQPHMKLELKHRYGTADQFLLSVVSLVTFAIIFHGVNILSWWISPDAASAAKWPLLFLTAGSWIAALISNVYSLAIAAGQPNYYLKINISIVLPYAVAVYFFISFFGVAGAAFAWFLLNLVYAFLIVPVIHREILSISTTQWLRATVMPFVVIGLLAFGVPKLAVQVSEFKSIAASEALALMVGIILYVVGVCKLLVATLVNLPGISTFFSREKNGKE